MNAFIITHQGKTHTVALSELGAGRAADTVAAAYGYTERPPKKELGMLRRSWSDRNGNLAMTLVEHSTTP